MSTTDSYALRELGQSIVDECDRFKVHGVQGNTLIMTYENKNVSYYMFLNEDRDYSNVMIRSKFVAITNDVSKFIEEIRDRFPEMKNKVMSIATSASFAHSKFHGLGAN